MHYRRIVHPMIQLRCTANAQKMLGLESSDLSPITQSSSILGNWYVNLFTVDRRKTLIFMNEHPVRQVNHQEEYSADDGTNQNQAESFFSRIFIGQIHKCNPKYLIFYGQEIAWREDNRRQSCGWLFDDLMKRCLSCRPSKEWSNYWQGNHREGDTLFISG